MKKYILILIVLSTIHSVADAQSKYYRRSEPRFGYGVRAGAGISGQTTTNKDAGYKVRNILGFNAGGYCNYFFFKYLAFQPELNISQRGSHWEDFYDNMQDDVTYLDLPLLVRFQPVRYFNVHAGPQVSYRLKATQKDMETGIKSEIEDYYRSFDYGIAVGIEANLPNHINLTIRYIVGLLPATTIYEYTDPWYNNSLQFSIGYRIKGR
ncbi:MAG: porin family protein [Bacteroidales bacterium]